MVRTVDPPFTGRFTLEVDGVKIGAFTEVTGLTVTVDVEELAEGGQNGFTHKLLGRTKWPNLVFKRGLTDTDALFEWLMEQSGDGFAKNGNKVKPRNARICVLTAKGEVMRSWSVLEAKPVKWSGPKLAASARDLAVEELEVCHSGFRSGK